MPNLRLIFIFTESTCLKLLVHPNLVALSITSQEIGRGGALLPPNQNRTIK